MIDRQQPVERGGNYVTAGNPSNSDNLNGGNCGHSGDKLNIVKKQQVKTTTTRVYTFMA